MTDKDDKVVKGNICIECMDSSTEVMKAIGKMSSEQREKVIKEILNKHLGAR